MFKKLAVIFVLCFSIQFVSAELLATYPKSEDILYQSEDLTYQDEGYMISIKIDKELQKNGKTIKKLMYNVFTSKEGGQEIAKNLQTNIESAFQVPNKAIYTYIASIDQKKSVILSHISKELTVTVVVFVYPDESSKDWKTFLSSPVAKRAFKKAGITLTKKQINSLVQIQ